MDALDRVVEQNRGEYLGWMVDYLKRPSLAGQGIGVEDGANATVEMLERVGARAEVWRREGAAPVVYGEIGDGPITLLVYDHYDVQPAEPLDLWETPPFEPSIRDGKLYARGSSDNRGVFSARIAAVDAFRKASGPLPLRLKFLVEGEEEIGSPHLAGYVDEYRDRLAADGILWEGGGWDDDDRLSIPLGGKGLAYIELHVKGPDYDLHSSNAAVVDNPAWRLVQALNTLRDPSGRVLVDGLMDAVRPLTPEDEAALSAMPLDPEKMKESFQADHLLAEDPEELKRLYIFGSTCNICGLSAGYSGAGPKTVLPSHAMAKLDFRLVHDLTPELVAELLRAHLDRRGFADFEIRLLSAIAPSRSPVDSALARTCMAAAHETFSRPAYLVPMAPSSGPFPLFAEGLGLPLVSAGATAYAGSRAHSPNENIRLDDWQEDIKFMARLFAHFATER